MTHPVNNFWLKDYELKGMGARFFLFDPLKRTNSPKPDWRAARPVGISHVVRAGFGVVSLALLVPQWRCERLVGWVEFFTRPNIGIAPIVGSRPRGLDPTYEPAPLPPAAKRRRLLKTKQSPGEDQMTLLRRLGAACLATMLLALAAEAAMAQAPRTVRIVVPYPPGSGPDILSRLLSEQIAQANGPTIVVENRRAAAP